MQPCRKSDLSDGQHPRVFVVRTPAYPNSYILIGTIGPCAAATLDAALDDAGFNDPRVQVWEAIGPGPVWAVHGPDRPS